MSNPIRKKTCDTAEVLLYIGSREGYDGPLFTREDVHKAIADYQDCYPKSLPVRLSDRCTFIAGNRYHEDGFEVSAITYPNHYRSLEEIEKFMMGLAEHLLNTFKQNRVTVRKVVSNTTTVMLERDTAQHSSPIN